MFIRHGIKNTLRSRKRTAVFFLLMTLLVTMLGASLGLTYGVTTFLNECREKYTTVGVLEYTGDLSEKGRETMRKAFEALGNGPENAGRILPIPIGFKLTPMDIKLTDAQYLELQNILRCLQLLHQLMLHLKYHLLVPILCYHYYSY